MQLKELLTIISEQACYAKKLCLNLSLDQNPTLEKFQAIEAELTKIDQRCCNLYVKHVNSIIEV